MYTLLPEQKVARIKLEYRLRFITVLTLSIGIAIAVGAISLLPSYILSSVKETEILNEVAVLVKQRTAGSDVNEKTLQSAQVLVSALEKHRDFAPLSSVVENVLRHQNTAVTMTTLTVARAASSTAVVQLAGGSLNREALVAFKNALEADPRVTRVDLPISNLAKSRDIHFSMNIYMNQ